MLLFFAYIGISTKLCDICFNMLDQPKYILWIYCPLAPVHTIVTITFSWYRSLRIWADLPFKVWSWDELCVHMGLGSCDVGSWLILILIDGLAVRVVSQFRAWSSKLLNHHLLNCNFLKIGNQLGCHSQILIL